MVESSGFLFTMVFRAFDGYWVLLITDTRHSVLDATSANLCLSGQWTFEDKVLL